MLKIGVLALQGAFIEHIKMLEDLGHEAVEIRQKKDFLKSLDGLIIPGGESTVIGRLIKLLKLKDCLKEAISGGMAVLGTCAGLIILARTITGEEAHLPLMDITVCRNAYGRQLGSFTTSSPFGSKGEIPMVFIRAPYIESAGKRVEILSITNNRIVAAREGSILVTAFHPELTKSTVVHDYFIDLVRSKKNTRRLLAK